MASFVVDTPTDGDVVVPAVAEKRVRILGLDLTAAGQVVVSLKSDGTDQHLVTR